MTFLEIQNESIRDSPKKRSDKSLFGPFWGQNEENKWQKEGFEEEMAKKWAALKYRP